MIDDEDDDHDDDEDTKKDEATKDQNSHYGPSDEDDVKLSFDSSQQSPRQLTPTDRSSPTLPQTPQI